jgi:hypothetical protein
MLVSWDKEEKKVDQISGEGGLSRSETKHERRMARDRRACFKELIIKKGPIPERLS